MMLDTLFEADYFTAPAGCVTRGNPTILHCFPAHKTELTEEHRIELDRIAIRVAESGHDGKPIRKIRIIGHAAVWRGLSEAEYLRRSRARAKSAAKHLRDVLARSGLSKSVRITTSGKGTSEELVPSNPASTSRKARRNRELNRRIEIFLTAPDQPKPKRKCTNKEIARHLLSIDWDRFFKSTSNPVIKSKTHRFAIRCIVRKITGKLVDGDEIDDDMIVGWDDLRKPYPKPKFQNFTEELRKICTRKSKLTASDVSTLYLRMVRPISSIVPTIRRVLIDLTPHPFGGPSLREIKAKIRECRAVKPIYLRSRRTRSIYYCMRGYVRPAIGACFT